MKKVFFIIILLILTIHPFLSKASQNSPTSHNVPEPVLKKESVAQPTAASKQQNKTDVAQPTATSEQQNKIREKIKNQSQIQERDYTISEILKYLLIAIIGGLTTYYIPKIVQCIISKYRSILVYQFDEDGTNDNPQKRVCHSWGQQVVDESASYGKAWRHTSQNIHNNGESTCYGPYTKEIPFRGKYRAKFRIKANGIKNKEDVLIMLDITHGIVDTNGHVTILGLPLVEKKLLGKHFIENKYKDFNVDFDYDGQSLIEFRCKVQNPTNYKKYVEEIYFDNVKIYELKGIFN